jgi:GT2 family glycosyltransferase
LRAELFLYFEDIDWCLRARKAGWRCRLVGEVLASHAVSSSAGTSGSDDLSPTSAYYRARNPLRFARETPRPALRATRTFGVLVVRGAYFGLQLARTRRREVAAAYLAGTRDGLRGVLGRRAA